MDAIRPTAAPSPSQRHTAERSKARQIASTIASARRTCDTSPNCVKLSTSRSAPDITASPRLSALNDIVSNSTKISPENTAAASPIHATARTCLWTSAFAGGAARKAGSATKPRNIRAPANVAEAAKWTVRVTINGPSTSAPNQLIALSRETSLPDLEGEIAVGCVRVHRKHTPRHMVCSGSPGAQRYRHLGAADARFTRINALTCGVGDGDGAERCLQVLREPQRHLVRSCRDLIADARFGMIEKSMGCSFARREQEQQRDYPNDF